MRGSRSLRLLAALMSVALCAALFVFPTTAFAAEPGTGGWYWPTGSESFGTMSDWWDDRGAEWHLAQDMGLACGQPVYAIGDGTVLESRYVDDYGPNGTQGGAVVILHKTASGIEFKALYGHLSNLKFKMGDTVHAGDTIGTINALSPNHLHFGIHPGSAYPSDGNPFRGHTYSSKQTYGWVDPMAFLRSNSRVADSTSSKTVSVSSAPVNEAQSAVAIKNSTDTAIRSSDAIETCGWEIAPGTSKLLALVNSQPKLSPTCLSSMTTLTWNIKLGTGGRLTNSAGNPLSGVAVVLQRYNGSSWDVVARSLTNNDGRWHTTYPLAQNSQVRAQFVLPGAYFSANGDGARLLAISPIVKPVVPGSVSALKFQTLVATR